MARPKTAPGTYTEIEAHAHVTVDGKRVRTPNVRRATIWRARCTYCHPDGRVEDIARWRSTKALAVAAVNEALKDRTHTNTAVAMRPSMPFPDACKVWRQQIERPEAGLADNTRRDYNGHLDRTILGEGSPLKPLTLAQVNDVQVLLSFLQGVADKRGSATAKSCRNVLSGILGMAMRRGVLPYNAARSTGAVKSATAKTSDRDLTRSFTKAERDHVIATADVMAAERLLPKAETGKRPDPRSAFKWAVVADLLALMAGTGVRINEARMLRWDDLDLDNKTVHIRGTKTDGSDRRLNLPGWVAERLTRRHDMAERSPVFVFCVHRVTAEHVANGFLGQVPDKSNLHGWAGDVIERAGFPWAVPHTFRRTVATLLHEAGVPLNKIADQLGHADPSMTARVYLGRELTGDKSDLAALL